MYLRTITTIVALICVLAAHSSEGNSTPNPSCPPPSSYQPPTCSSACTADYAPVCGYNGKAIETFSNSCELSKFNKCNLPKGSKPYQKILDRACCPETIGPIVILAVSSKQPTAPVSVGNQTQP